MSQESSSSAKGPDISNQKDQGRGQGIAGGDKSLSEEGRKGMEGDTSGGMIIYFKNML